MEYPLAQHNSHAQKPSSQKILCMKCNKEKLSCNFQNEGNTICNHCKKSFKCVNCWEIKPKGFFTCTERQKEKSTCKSCKSSSKRKCLDCNIEKTRHHFSRRAWKLKKLKCEACVQAQMKTCFFCNIEKPYNDFDKREWKNEKSRCLACIKVQMEIYLSCKIKKQLKALTLPDNSVLSDFDNENKVSLSIVEESPKRPREDVDVTEIGPAQKRKKQETSDEKALQKRVDEAEVQIRNQNERLKKLEQGKAENWNKTVKLIMNMARLEQEKHEYAKKNEDMRENLRRLEQEKNEYAKKNEDMRENLRRLEQEKDECAKKNEDMRENLRRLEQEKDECAKKNEEQSKSIQQLEEGKVLLKRKNEKLTGVQDLSDRLKAELECPICLDPLDNPYMNPECGHRFCYRCITQSISKCGKECPLCRVKIMSKRGLRKDKLIGSITKVVFRDDECIEIN